MSPEHYQDRGYARFDGAIGHAAAAAAARWIVTHRDRTDVASTHDRLNRNNRLPIKLRQLWNCDPVFWQHFLFDSGVLALPRALLGPEFLLIRSAAFIKYPHSSTFVGWHCDADLWGHPCEAGLTAWVPLTPVPRHSGCLQLLPGSHRAPPGKLGWDLRHPFHKVMDVSAMAAPEAVTADVGDCIVMDRRTVHSSGPNNSDHERIGLVLAFARCAHADLNEPAVALGPGDRHEQIVPA
ncbi:phytanoyl-CoA dioxygenase family protein [Massilia sp. DWR3-1-1]|uniref:phytanoyl-CoA dioxygenase family protein n=1 Tax=Massilia sp. DWR3-1-1 TaxID=2804559 RepID=UPI003CF0999D